MEKIRAEGLLLSSALFLYLRCLNYCAGGGSAGAGVGGSVGAGTGSSSACNRGAVKAIRLSKASKIKMLRFIFSSSPRNRIFRFMIPTASSQISTYSPGR